MKNLVSKLVLKSYIMFAEHRLRERERGRESDVENSINRAVDSDRLCFGRNTEYDLSHPSNR